ncbi:MAG: BlaI/MecI/CopY family transcriptional regulator, partial [Planctomycetes bacterium]|nr:BlaI/MecI/CopY family transcriptional regulator [Planctomycetota bacterium]
MKKQDRPNISPAEMEVLRLLWQLKEATVNDVHAHLPDKRDVAYCTVQTLLRRLESKGHVSHHKRGKAFVFTPNARQDDVLKASVG